MPDYAALIDQLLATVTLEEIGPDVYEGQSHDYVGKRIFGGQVLAQALMAGARTLKDDKPCHSFHSYFLSGGDISRPVVYQVRRLRDGRTLSARQITAVQYKDDKNGGEPVEQVIFSMIASFSDDEAGLDYQGSMPVYPPPDDLLTEQELKEEYVGSIPEALQARFMRQRHVEIKPVKPRNPISPEPMKPQQANWLRINELGEQPVAIQQALLAFASDFYLVGTGLMPHGVSFMTKGLQAASIDHSMHFHRPFDINNWLLYDMRADTTANAKGLNHGQFWQDGKLVASVQQEGLMRLRQ